MLVEVGSSTRHLIINSMPSESVRIVFKPAQQSQQTHPKASSRAATILTYQDFVHSYGFRRG